MSLVKLIFFVLMVDFFKLKQLLNSLLVNIDYCLIIGGKFVMFVIGWLIFSYLKFF